MNWALDLVPLKSSLQLIPLTNFDCPRTGNVNAQRRRSIVPMPLQACCRSTGGGGAKGLLFMFSDHKDDSRGFFCSAASLEIEFFDRSHNRRQAELSPVFVLSIPVFEAEASCINQHLTINRRRIQR